MYHFKSFILLFFFSLPYFCYAQTYDFDYINTDIQLIFEDIYSELVEEGMDVDFEQLTEQLTELMSSPINLNNTTEEQLSTLPFLNRQQIDDILLYAYTNTFYSLYELRLISSLKDYEIRDLIPFVFVGDKPSNHDFYIKDVFHYAKHEIDFRFDARNIEKNGNDPFYSSLKYKFDYNNKVLFGLTLERDVVEPFYSSKKIYGADFYGAYIQLNNLWKFKRIIFGDFNVSFGEGLVVNTNLNYNGKMAYVLNKTYNSNTLQRKSSTKEYDFMRGVASQIEFNNIQLSLFYSARRIDASLENGRFPSIRRTGYHRTDTEIDSKQTVWQQNAGANLDYKFSNARIGITATLNSFSDTLSPTPNNYNANYFSGKRQLSFGFHYNWRIRKFNLSGEIATAQNKHWGVGNITTLQFTPINDLHFSLTYRYYSKSFDNLNANALSSSSICNNEMGLLLATNISLIPKLNLVFYTDIYRYTFPKYNSPEPYFGYDILALATYTANSKVNMKWKARVKQVYTYDKYSLNYYINILLGNLSLRTMVDANIAKQYNEVSFGVLIAENVEYRFSFPLTLQARIEGFYSPNYLNRFYAYENDVLYAFSIPSLYGIGGRGYINLRYKINKHFSLYLKLSETVYTKKWKEVGHLSTNHQTDIHAFLRVCL